MLDSARGALRVPSMARWLLGWVLSRRWPRTLPHGLGRLEDEQQGLTGGEHGPQAVGCPRAAEHVMDLRGR